MFCNDLLARNSAIRIIFFALSLFFLPVLSGNHAYAAAARVPLIVTDEARAAEVVQQVPLTGTVTSPKIARISAQVSGQVKSLKVEAGDKIMTGDVLLELDSALEMLTLEAAGASSRQALAELEDARRRYKDAQVLRQQKTIAANEIDLLKAEVQIDEAALAKQQAQEKKQRALVERYTVKAPFAGIISEKNTENGEWISPGTPVMTLVDIENLRIDFRVPQELYPQIDEKSRITITFDAIPGRSFEGIINTLVPVSDPSARTFLMRVTVTEKNLQIMPGMSVHGTLQLNSGQQGVVVSRDALLRYPDGRITVWTVVTENGQTTVTEKNVKTGHSFNGYVSINEGLQAGDKIVVRGNEALQQGQTVQVQNPQ